MVSSSGWEDRLGKEQVGMVHDALDRWSTSHHDGDVLYTDLVDAGMYPEEAEEYVDLCMES